MSPSEGFAVFQAQQIGARRGARCLDELASASQAVAQLAAILIVAEKFAFDAVKLSGAGNPLTISDASFSQLVQVKTASLRVLTTRLDLEPHVAATRLRDLSTRCGIGYSAHDSVYDRAARKLSKVQATLP